MTPPETPGGELPNFDAMTPEEMMAWLESLARRQGVAEEELTTDANMVIAEPPPDTVIDEPGYTPYSALSEAGGPAPARPEPSPAAPPEPEPPALPEPIPEPVGEVELTRIEEPETLPTTAGTGFEGLEGLEGIDETILADPMAWLESLARRQGVAEEELTTAANVAIVEPPPDAVIDEPGYTPFDPGRRLAAEAAPPEPEPVAEIAPVAEPEVPAPALAASEGVEEIEAFEGLDAQILADPMVWLESLARRQGVSEEELVTAANLDIPSPPPDTIIEEPGYVPYDAFAEARPSAIEEAAPPKPAAEPEPAISMEMELPPAELVEELAGLEVTEAMPALEEPVDLFAEALPAPEEEPTALPDWLMGARPAAPAELPELEAFGAEPAGAVPGMAGEARDESLAWLESLASEQGAVLADFLSGAPPAAPEVEEAAAMLPQAEWAAAPEETAPADLWEEIEATTPTISQAMAAFTEETVPSPPISLEAADPLAGLSDAEIEERMARGELTREQQQAWLERQTDKLLAAREEGAVFAEEAAFEELPPAVPAEIPDWLADQMPGELVKAAEPAPLSEEIVPPPAPAELPEWLSSLAEVEAALPAEPMPALAPEPAEAGQPPIDWLAMLAEAVEEEEPFFAMPEEVEAAPAVIAPTEAELAPLPAEEELPAGEPGPLPAWLTDLVGEAPLAPAADEALGWLTEAAEAEVALPLAEPALDTSLEWLSAADVTAAEEEAEVAAVVPEDIAAWLRQQEEAPLAATPGEALPAWLTAEAEEVAEEAYPFAVDAAPPAAEEAFPVAAEPAPMTVPEMPEVAEEIAPPLPVVEAPPPPVPAPAVEPVAAAPPAPAAAPVTPLEPASPQAAAEWFARARQLKAEREFVTSLVDYERLIRAEQHLDEVTKDLEDIAQQLAASVEVRRLLGDAYLRQNRLQEALDTYRSALEQL